MPRIAVNIDDHSFEVDVKLLPAGTTSTGRLSVVANGEWLDVVVPSVQGREAIEWVMVGSRPYELSIDPALHWIKAYDGLHTLEVHDLETIVARPVSKDGRVKAPIPGLVTRVMVRDGERVEVGQPLLVLEAMKMENEIVAPRSGLVGSLSVSAGRTVNLGDTLVDIT
jgi:biotin carboxyl carrier protein